MNNLDFLPISRADMEQRGWYYCDFLLVTGDAYVDHPSFGTAIIGRVLEQAGYRVAVLAQPDFHSPRDFLAFGPPRYAVLVNGGNIDSMVAHYSVAKHRRKTDSYSPGGRAGLRPDRAATVYAQLARQAFPDAFIALGGLEASLRRFAHYDYWADAVHPSILLSSGADAVMFGMGENTVLELAAALKKGRRGTEGLRGIRGLCYWESEESRIPFERVTCPSCEQVQQDKRLYAQAALEQQRQQDAHWGKAVCQKHGERLLVQTPPPLPLTTAQMDAVYALPYARTYHPVYESMGGVAAIQEVRFSLIHNRGCFGGCNFCSLAFHQGRYISVRSHDSVVAEAEQIAALPDFKGYIHDVGGPTANFRYPACQKQEKHGLCPDKMCLTPAPCPQLRADHSDYLNLLRRLRQVPGVKKVFVRSGLRYDYMLCGDNGRFLRELAEHHISGQLKVAPEHCSSRVLSYMGKPSFEVYERFREQYGAVNRRLGKEQYLVPYLMSSHPGCQLEDAIELALYLKRIGHMPQQVQDFYPTPGTLSTAMYYTGLDPRTMKPVFVPKSPKEKAMQRALLQWRKPENHALVRQALREAGRQDLIGYGQHALVPPPPGERGGFVRAKTSAKGAKPTKPAKPTKGKGRPASGKAKPKDKGRPKKR